MVGFSIRTQRTQETDARQLMCAACDVPVEVSVLGDDAICHCARCGVAETLMNASREADAAAAHIGRPDNHAFADMKRR